MESRDLQEFTDDIEPLGREQTCLDQTLFLDVSALDHCLKLSCLLLYVALAAVRNTYSQQMRQHVFLGIGSSVRQIFGTVESALAECLENADKVIQTIESSDVFHNAGIFSRRIAAFKFFANAIGNKSIKAFFRQIKRSLLTVSKLVRIDLFPDILSSKERSNRRKVSPVVVSSDSRGLEVVPLPDEKDHGRQHSQSLTLKTVEDPLVQEIFCDQAAGTCSNVLFDTWNILFLTFIAIDRIVIIQNIVFGITSAKLPYQGVFYRE